MKYPAIIFAILFVEVTCRSLVPSLEEESNSYTDKNRSVRVHRISSGEPPINPISFPIAEPAIDKSNNTGEPRNLVAHKLEKLLLELAGKLDVRKQTWSKHLELFFKELFGEGFDKLEQLNIYENNKSKLNEIESLSENEIQTGAEFLDNMLINVQADLGRIRKYFEKLCRKHHEKTLAVSGSHDNYPVMQ